MVAELPLHLVKSLAIEISTASDFQKRRTAFFSFYVFYASINHKVAFRVLSEKYINFDGVTVRCCNKGYFFSGSYANNLDDAHSFVSFLEHLSNAEKENVMKKTVH